MPATFVTAHDGHLTLIVVEGVGALTPNPNDVVLNGAAYEFFLPRMSTKSAIARIDKVASISDVRTETTDGIQRAALILKWRRQYLAQVAKIASTNVNVLASLPATTAIWFDMADGHISEIIVYESETIFNQPVVRIKFDKMLLDLSDENFRSVVCELDKGRLVEPLKVGVGSSEDVMFAPLAKWRTSSSHLLIDAMARRAPISRMSFWRVSAIVGNAIVCAVFLGLYVLRRLKKRQVFNMR
jgi:hypothetical protein